MICAREKRPVFPIKPLGTGSLIRFPRGHFTCPHGLLLEELSVSCLSLLGESSSKLVSGFLWSLAHVPLPLADFALCPSSIINHSHEHNHGKVPWVLPANLGVGLGDIDSQMGWGYFGGSQTHVSPRVFCS